MFHPVHAPEIDQPGLEWFNVAAPLSLGALRGKLVILDFWTFCCVNCLHVLPALRRVEEAFPDEVVVVGVHSPKFSAESEPENVSQAIRRYGIRHPVAHDPEMRLWQLYAVRAWPTLVFVAPDGRIIDQVPGEPHPERLVAAVGQLVEAARRQGVLLPAPLDLTLKAAPAGRFAFPAKMKRLPDGGDSGAVWALADSGHHQIALLNPAGDEVGRIGSGAVGFDDGEARAATFNAPQGLVAAPGAIYVADTGNHAVRKVDLETSRVTTLAGTGARGGVLGGARPASHTALASPWDLEIDGARLYVANAGSHQLALIDLEAGSVERLAGDGGESIEDGPAATARLAQPSGLCLGPDRRTLYFVDSETSAVRAVALSDESQVITLVGTGLFDFGHVNGDFPYARLQHPLGIAVDGQRLVVADSYNRALRVLDPHTRRVADLDDGYRCEDPICLPAGEPAGVVADDCGRIFMVDTNNHRVVAYRPADRAYRTWAG